MPTDKDTVHIGPCKVTFDIGGDTPFVIDKTAGPVKFTYEETTKEIKVTQTGDTPIDEIVIGRNVMAEVPMTRRDLDALLLVIPGSEKVGDARVDVYANKVVSLLDYANTVTIEPLSEKATTDDTITIYNAAPRAKLNYTYDYNNEQITDVTFKGYPDADGKLVGFGDPTAV
ncbi:hypothetical protein [Chengkuizengella axinellae]|uniref:Uncharacterized protein n=1 Tax=Chengkuizengella axinellae TaxID=3064388 RepID=A0ABT9IYH2_9BACL|nr:hypothetical protein [Chengkuizengella sp. 2205SS18-9]MDP5274353.1 hypothetical protein [Chengkuizengella sp. 2205SS18-9]